MQPQTSCDSQSNERSLPEGRASLLLREADNEGAVGEWKWLPRSCGRGSSVGYKSVLFDRLRAIQRRLGEMPEYAANPSRRTDFKLHGCAGVRKFQLVLRQQGIRNRAMAYLDRGNSDGAIADIAQVIHRYPTNVYAYASRGFAYLQKGDFDRAIADYTRLIDVGTL